MIEMNEVTIIVTYDDNGILIVNDDLELRERYTLNKIPEKSSMIIQQDMRQISQGLQIGSIIVNLNNAAGLMLVAATALTGTKLSSKMSALQKDLLDICSDSLVSVTTFVDRSKAISEYVIKAYDWLTKGKEGVALKQFYRCAEQAKKMADEAEKLAKRFEVIANKTETVLEATQDEQALQYDKIDELKNELAKYNADLGKQEENQKILLEDIGKMQKLYTELRKKEDKLMDRQFGLQIASVIASSFSGVVTLFSPDLGGKSDGASEAIKLLENEMKNKNETLNSLNTEKNANLAKKENLTQEIDDTKAKIKALEDKNGESKEGEEAIKKMLDTVSAYSIELKAIMIAVDLVTKKINDINDTIKETANKLNEIAKSTQSDVERVNAEKQMILNKKLDMEKERRNALADIKKFTVLIKNNADQDDTAKTAVETLQVAVRCLKQIVVALSNAALFWRSMQRYCENLSAEGSISIEIEDLMDAYEEKERIAIYREPQFMLKMLQYLCKWSALYHVSTEYLDEIRKIREKVTQNIEYAPSKADSKKLASKMADEMGERITLQIKEADELIDYIGKE